MENLYTARDAMDANFLRGLLEEEEIAAVVQGEPLQEGLGSLNLSGDSLPSVWVEESDVLRARPIVDEYKRRQAATARSEQNALEDGSAGGAAVATSRKTWVCQNCGQRIEEQFTKCWHCGHDRKMGGDSVIV